jgi:hypothetical protein
MLLALELAVGVAFGVAGASGATSVPASSAPAHVLLGDAPLVTVLPSTRPVAVVNELPVAGPPAGPVVGPAIGPLVPGTVRPAVVDVPAGTVSPPVASPPPYRRHAARNPFLTLVRG